MYAYKTQLRRILYRLKREAGQAIVLYKVASMANDVRTGKSVITYTVIPVKRAIMLPRELNHRYSYDLTFLAANKNFQYGATYDAGDRAMILDGRDLPNQTLDLQWHYIYQHKRFDLKKVEYYDFNLALYITATETECQLPFEYHDMNVEVQIDFLEQSSGVKS